MRNSHAIEVACNLEDYGYLDPADVSPDGDPRHLGTFLISLSDVPDDVTALELEAAAIWHFFSSISISCPEDYEIDCRAVVDESTTPTAVTQDLGEKIFLRIEGDTPAFCRSTTPPCPNHQL